MPILMHFNDPDNFCTPFRIRTYYNMVKRIFQGGFSFWEMVFIEFVSRRDCKKSRVTIRGQGIYGIYMITGLGKNESGAIVRQQKNGKGKRTYEQRSISDIVFDPDRIDDHGSVFSAAIQNSRSDRIADNRHADRKKRFRPDRARGAAAVISGIQSGPDRIPCHDADQFPGCSVCSS